MIEMGWKPKKKQIVLSKEEQDYVKMKLEESKKLFKPLKGEIVIKRDDCSQPWSLTARYFTEDDLEKDAKDIVARLDRLDESHHWKVISTKIIRRIVVDEEDKENADNV